MKAMPPIIAAHDLTFAYGETPALRGVDLTLRAGETLALLGPNGAGKSSLLRLIAGRLAPRSGEVRVAGGDPASDPAARRTIGWVPQEIGLYPRLTVAENLDIFARLAGLARAARKRALATLLDRTGTAEVAHRLVGTLSGGYQRRVNIAASLVAEPRLILLDEPTQGVDLEAREAIHTLLLSLRAAGAALLVSTHDFAEAERLADRIAILHEGRILREGSLHALLRPYADAPPEQEARLAAPPDGLAEAVLRRRGFVPLPETLVWRASHGVEDGLEGASLLAAFRAEGVAVAEIRLRRPGLESLYRAMLAPERVPPFPVRRTPAEALP